MIPGEPPNFKQKTQCLDANTEGHLEMERASVDQLLTVMAPFTLGQEKKKIYAIKTDFKGHAKNPWPIRGQNAQRTGRASKNLLRKYGGKHDYELKTEGK